MDILVEFKSLSKSFKNNKLVENVSFKLKKGEITTLIGQNGAGKTTLTKMLLGLEGYDSGEIHIKENINIGYVPQNLDLNFDMPIRSKELLKRLANVSYIDYDSFILKDFLDFRKIKNEDLSNISRGQLQKLILAGTLMQKPDLIVLDEPTQYLDVQSQQEFYLILKHLKEKHGITIFMVSHDLFTVMKNSDQVICLNKHVCCSGKPVDIKDNNIFKNALSEIGVYIHNHDHKH